MSNDQLKIGKLLRHGHYRVTKHIHSGGFGQTYIVLDTHLNEDKVLKRLKLNQDESSRLSLMGILRQQLDQEKWKVAQKKFDKEAKILKVLGEHPQIPRIFDKFPEQGEFYIVQELIDGGDLSTELGKQKQSEEYVVKLVWEVLQILEFVHYYDVIHRDISPSNIMRRGDGRLVLVDFGNVKQIKRNKNLQTWESIASSMIVRTQGFMAPEQEYYIAQDNTDIYALGMVAVYALTGIHPVQLQQQEVNNNLEHRWLKYAPGINQNLAAIVNRMVAHDHTQGRYQTVQEVMADLQKCFPQYAPAVAPFIINKSVLSKEIDIPSAEIERTLVVGGIKPLSQLTEFLKIKPKLSEFLLFFFGSALVTTSVSLVLNAAYTLGTGQVFAIYVSVFVVILFIRYKFFPKRERTIQSQDVDSRIYLHSYNFPVITLDGAGKKIDEKRGEAKYFREELGNGVTLDMVQISGGEFQMGVTDQEVEEAVKNAVSYGSDEANARTWANWGKPRHLVKVPDFSMGKFLVTQAQWKQVAAMKKVKIELTTNPEEFTNFKGKELPVNRVNWYQAVEFCQRLSKHTGNAYRLPSEAEWEYACRSHTETPFHFGATITPEYVNYNGNYPYAQAAKGEYRSKTTPVGSFPPNGFGLYDMHGNLWEWCEDDWHDNYQDPPKDGKAWTDNDNRSQGKTLIKVLRGGSWSSHARYCRSGIRYRLNAEYVNLNYGFRVACLPFLPRTH